VVWRKGEIRKTKTLKIRVLYKKFKVLVALIAID
jgi:hypothetical protein